MTARIVVVALPVSEGPWLRREARVVRCGRPRRRRLSDDPGLRRAVRLALRRGLTVSAAARAAGVSRDVVYECLGRRRKQRPRRQPHGTWSTYCNHGCRCLACSRAARHYSTERVQQRTFPLSLTGHDNWLADGDEFHDPTAAAALARTA